MTPTDHLRVLEAVKTAHIAHQGQVRKGSGLPYITHPLNVAQHLIEHKESHKITDLIIAAVLHDTLEDTPLSPQEIEAQFGPLVLQLVQELTSDREEITKLGKTQYLSQKVTQMSSWALNIKLCDRLDNVLDMKCMNQKFIEKYTRETREILKYLEENRQLTNTQKSIINKIKNTLSTL